MSNPSEKACKIKECGKTSYAKSLCRKHYSRLLTHGDPLFFKGRERGEVRKFYETVVLQYDGNECLIWPYNCSKGYGLIKKDGKTSSVHRLACEEQNGPPPTPTHEAAHGCGNGNKGCVTKRHLSWKTPKENSADKILHGTSNRGEKRHSAKLSDRQAREILSLKGKELQREIARKFGVSRDIVCHLHTGRTWAWLNEEGSK